MACTTVELARPVELVVRENGTFELQGRPVAAAQLAAELRRLSAPGAFELQVSAASRAKHQAVEVAFAAIREAGISHVAFRTLE